MHVEAVAERLAKFDVMRCGVTASRATSTGNRVAVPVEEAPLNQADRLVVAHPVAQPLVLAVVDVAVVDVMIDPAPQINAGVGEAADLAIIDFEAIMAGHHTARYWELIKIVAKRRAVLD
jgi:hypothetical protein